MSKQVVSLNTGNQAIIKTDVAKIFIWNNRFQDADYTNGTGGTVNLAAGTLMGRIHATGKIVPLVAAAADGSNLPVGILNEDWSIANGVTQKMSICVDGDVAEEQIICNGAETLDTVVGTRRLRDHLKAQGINPVTSTDLTGYDNE